MACLISALAIIFRRRRNNAKEGKPPTATVPFTARNRKYPLSWPWRASRRLTDAIHGLEHPPNSSPPDITPKTKGKSPDQTAGSVVKPIAEPDIKPGVGLTSPHSAVDTTAIKTAELDVGRETNLVPELDPGLGQGAESWPRLETAQELPVTTGPKNSNVAHELPLSSNARVLSSGITQPGGSGGAMSNSMAHEMPSSSSRVPSSEPTQPGATGGPANVNTAHELP